MKMHVRAREMGLVNKHASPPRKNKFLLEWPVVTPSTMNMIKTTNLSTCGSKLCAGSVIQPHEVCKHATVMTREVIKHDVQ